MQIFSMPSLLDHGLVVRFTGPDAWCLEGDSGSDGDWAWI